MLLSLKYMQSLAQISNDPNTPVGGADGSDINLPQVGATTDTLKNLMVFVFGIIIVVSIIYIIIGGIQLIISTGDPQKIAKARMTILYSVVGLVIAVSAEVIVMFVLGRI